MPASGHGPSDGRVVRGGQKPGQVDEIDRRHVEVIDRHVQCLEDGGVPAGEDARLGRADPVRLRLGPDRGVVDPAAGQRRQRHVQVDLDRRPGPGDLVVVGVVESRRGGARLEAEAIEDLERRAPVLARDQQIDVGGWARGGAVVETRLVVEPLEHDGRHARRGERADALLGGLAEDHVAGAGDDAIAAKCLGQRGWQRRAAGDREQRRQAVVARDRHQRGVVGRKRGRPRRLLQRRQ